jgi:hypothetical protein
METEVMAADGSTTPTIPEHPSVQLARMRQKAEAGLDRILAIAEEILAVIDDLGPNPDEEPSLGFLESTGGNPYAHGYGDQRHVFEGATDDREAEPDEHNVGWESHGAQLRLDAGSDDLEPALGRTEALDQRPQRAGSGHEDEPTMGSLDRRDQTGWAHNHDANDSEREEVSEDEGAQDDREADYGDFVPLDDATLQAFIDAPLSPDGGPKFAMPPAPPSNVVELGWRQRP